MVSTEFVTSFITSSFRYYSWNCVGTLSSLNLEFTIGL